MTPTQDARLREIAAAVATCDWGTCMDGLPVPTKVEHLFAEFLKNVPTGQKIRKTELHFYIFRKKLLKNYQNWTGNRVPVVHSMILDLLDPTRPSYDKFRITRARLKAAYDWGRPTGEVQ